MSDVKPHRFSDIGFAFLPQSDNSSLIGGKAKNLRICEYPSTTAKHRNSGAFFSCGGENVGCEVTPLMR